MARRHGRWAATALATAVLLAPGCRIDGGAPPPGAVLPDVSRVLIVDVGMVSRPAVGLERVYASACTVAYTAPDGTATGADLLALTVSTDRPDQLRIQIVDEETGDVLELGRVERPSGTDQPVICDGRGAVPDGVAELLARRPRVFWLAPADGDDDGLRYRATVAVRSADRPRFGRLKAFVTTTSGGAPLGGDDIELVDGFFYLAALGDSVMWGNGLREKDKFRFIVAREIESRTGLKVISSVRAVSGAPIVPYDDDGLCARMCDGEAPTVYTSVTLQAQSLERPAAMDLILLDGCANDVNLSRILSPETTSGEIADLAGEFCDSAMTDLLLEVRSRAPRAAIVVTGYYAFISASSDFSKVEEWAASHDVATQDGPLFGPLIANSAAFANASREELARAVTTVDGMDGEDPPFVFVDAGFAADNAAFAPNALVWGARIDLEQSAELGLDLRIVPEDPLFNHRLEACVRGGVAPDFVACTYGSVGHPNVAGAQAYAAAIMKALEDIGLVPDRQEPSPDG